MRTNVVLCDRCKTQRLLKRPLVVHTCRKRHVLDLEVLVSVLPSELQRQTRISASLNVGTGR